jgi:hypothetical protein
MTRSVSLGRLPRLERLLLLSYHWPKTQWIAKQGLWPKFGHCSWAFVLEPLEGGRTPLISRDRVRYAPLDLSVPLWPFFFVADLTVQPTMLHGIKRPVEQVAQSAEVEALDASRWGWSPPRPGP